MNFQDTSQKRPESLSHRNACRRSNTPFCIANWKESSGVDTFFSEKESIGKEEPAHQRRMLGCWEENIDGEDTVKIELQESGKEEVSLPEQLSVKPLVVLHEEPFVDMGESLPDCINKEFSIKVESFSHSTPCLSIQDISRFWYWETVFWRR